jgi:hypothetical protein
MVKLKRGKSVVVALLLAFLLAGGLVAYNGAAKRDAEERAAHAAPLHDRRDGRGPHSQPLVKQVIGDAIFFATHLVA